MPLYAIPPAVSSSLSVDLSESLAAALSHLSPLLSRSHCSASPRGSPSLSPASPLPFLSSLPRSRHFPFPSGAAAGVYFLPSQIPTPSPSLALRNSLFPSPFPSPLHPASPPPAVLGCSVRVAALSTVSFPPPFFPSFSGDPPLLRPATLPTAASQPQPGCEMIVADLLLIVAVNLLLIVQFDRLIDCSTVHDLPGSPCSHFHPLHFCLVDGKALISHSDRDRGRDRDREKMKWYVVAGFLTLLTSSQGILTTLSQSNGGYTYDYATVPFLAEIFKFSSMERVPVIIAPKDDYGLEDCALFADTLESGDAREYDVLEEKTLKPAVDGDCSIGCWNNHKPGEGLWGGIVRFSLFSSNTRLLVGNLVCLPFCACRFGAIFNMAKLLADDFKGGFEKGPWWQRLFNGYTITTWMVILNLGSSGLLVSWLMKYADNIVKVYSTSMAMLLTMVLSVYLFNFKPTIQLFLGIIICMMSLHMYFAPPDVLVDLSVASKVSLVKAGENEDIERRMVSS
ncbi:hypothetical protein ACLOJK_021999 [Asimina triloba]